jgi:hypothetical protein
MFPRRSRRGAVSAALVLVFWLVGGMSRAVAEETPSLRWFVTTQAGSFGLHEESGAGGALRFGRDLARHVSLDLGLALAGPEGFAFGSTDLGLTLRLCDPCRVTPFLVGSAGILGEAEWAGWWFGGGGGLAVRIAPSDSISITGRFAKHDGEPGPGMVVVGWTHRFGKGR